MKTLEDMPAGLQPPVQTSYDPADLRMLIMAAASPQVSLDEKEARIAAGESYGHFLTPEEAPGALQMQTYQCALERNGAAIASALTGLADQLAAQAAGQPITLLSLARAGFPVGIMLQRLLQRRGLDSVHFGVSIVRGIGLDVQALELVLAERPASSILFVDGWTGKGSILGTLRESLDGHRVQPRLAALYDPAGVADFAGSYADLLLPHAALNATVSGLISRTFLTEHGHAAEYLSHLAEQDVSSDYVNALDALCQSAEPLPAPLNRPDAPADLAFQIARAYGCTDAHRAKPGIGEATRVFLRRRPAALVLRTSTPDTAHLETMAQEGNIPVHLCPQLPYAAMSLIAELPEGGPA
jgi:Phosphoribosyl transferase (PRTase)/PELOTA RNA binding domain